MFYSSWGKGGEEKENYFRDGSTGGGGVETLIINFEGVKTAFVK